MNRRSFLALSALVGTLPALAACGETGQTGESLPSRAPLPEPFRVPLPVPPVARPVSTAGGVDEYRIVQRVAEQEILPGLRTRILGYDGVFPGPTIEARPGRTVVVRHRNELPVPTVVHLHGGHTPAADDGWPLDLLLPVGGAPVPAHHRGGHVTEGERTHRYPAGQRASTLWYHDHRMDFTGPAVYHGLAGFHLVRDEVEGGLPLPHGDRELPLMICDRSFAADGSFAYPGRDRRMLTLPGVRDEWMEGVLGDVVLVNGAPWPEHEVDAARYRLRILNASNARRLALRFEHDGRALPLHQIGSDGGLLARPVRHDSLTVAPGERFDVVVDFGSVPVGSTVTVRNPLGRDRLGDVMRFRVARKVRDDSRVPDRLFGLEPLRPGPVVREFVFTRGSVPGHGRSGWTINGSSFDPDSPIATVPLGSTERWRFRTDVHHPVHVHLDAFQVLRRGPGGPGAGDHGWKDTVDLPPAETVEVAVRFTGHPGRYVLHCHNLEHEDMAMMAALDIA